MKILFEAAGLALVLAAGLHAQTGVAVPEFAALDRDFPALMRSYGVPGGAVAVVKDGRLVFARGYGVADVPSGAPVQPDSLFRVGSISKTITAIALLHLYESGRLDLDGKVHTAILPHLQPLATPDPRLGDITVRQLLHHTGGRGRETGVDPLNASIVVEAAKAGPALGLIRDDIVRRAMGLPLHFDPGTKYSYSNYGFMLLARVVERIAGEPYEDFVRRSIFAPMGIRRAALGRGAYGDASPGEVRYYEVPRMILEFPLIPGARRLLPRPYANFELLAGDGCGQWIASPIDLVRFIAAVEGSRSPAYLKPATFELFLERPQPFVSEDPTGNSWYGLGTVAGVGGNGRSWTHAGAYPGSLAVYQSFGNGVAYAIALNAWPPDISAALTGVGRLVADFCLHQQTWPSHDLFPTYYPEN